jgi:hypothetical protein
MGGMGSGNRFRYDTKATVEESLSLAMKELRKRLYVGAAGMLTWTWNRGGQSSIRFYVAGSDDRPIVTLQYRWNDKEDVKIPIRLEATPTQFGGRRWWFICPLIVRGIACNRRAGKLYLPPGVKYFGCRKCHDLTYRSAQEAHQRERLFARLQQYAEIDPTWKWSDRKK